MAIKTVSQLDRFEAGTSGSGSPTVCGNQSLAPSLAFISNGYLTKNDKNSARALSSNDSYTKYAVGAETLTASSTIQLNPTSDETYWNSLFEISQTSPKAVANGHGNIIVNSYSSHSITYEDLLKTILWDTKSYLNYRNNLNDYNLSAIVEGNQYFKGRKTLAGSLSVSDSIYADYLSANSITANNMQTTGTAKIENLSVHTSLSIDCNISANTRNLCFDGYAFGLNDRDKNDKMLAGTHTSCGSTGHYCYFKELPSINGYERFGNPVCFVNGRPYELSSVNYANVACSVHLSGQCFSTSGDQKERNVVATSDQQTINDASDDDLPTAGAIRRYLSTDNFAQIVRKIVDQSQQTAYDIVDAIYPISSLYISVSKNIPDALTPTKEIDGEIHTITWEPLLSGYGLWIDSEHVGQKLKGIVPAHTHQVHVGTNDKSLTTVSDTTVKYVQGNTPSLYPSTGKQILSADISSLIDVGDTLRPPSYAVNVWKRIA